MSEFKSAEEIMRETLIMGDTVGYQASHVVKAMELYADQFKQQGDKWERVEDSLPKAGVKIRAIRTYGNGKMEETHTIWVERIETFDDLLGDCITHWQYITFPSPPTK